MKKFLLLFLTLITLTATGQDTLHYEKKFDPLTLKLHTFHNKIANLNLDLATFSPPSIDWKKITKFATIYGAVNGGNSLSDIDVYSVTNGL